MKPRIDMLKIGKAAKRQRVCTLKITQRRIAEASKIPVTSISDIENGRARARGARITTLDRLAASLGWSLVELIQASYREYI